MKLLERSWIGVAFIAAHVPFALLSKAVPVLGSAHFVLVALYTLLVMARPADPERAAALAAYIVGSEVYWRMTGGALFWEGGKYLIIVLLAHAGMRSRDTRGARAPFLYFLLLLPSCMITLTVFQLEDARSQLSFYLSGPAVLAVSAWFFSQFDLSRDDMRRIAVAFIAPTAMMLTISFVSSMSTEIRFSDVSNFEASGGYGPNQVSALLGLGAAMCFIEIVSGDRSRPLRLLLAPLLVGFIVQSALTFSRGGLYGASACTLVYLLFSARAPGTRLRVLGAVLAIAVLSEAVLYPWLEARTNGAITERFTDTRVTGRDYMAANELQAFFDEPIFGIGPGGGRAIRDQKRSIASHTEYTRLLAEHGLFGLAALLVVVFMTFRRLKVAAPGIERARAGALVMWSAVFMLHAAMRLAAPGFIFGLAMAGMVSPAARRESHAEEDPEARPVLADAAT